MKRKLHGLTTLLMVVTILIGVGALGGCATPPRGPLPAGHGPTEPESFYLPNAEASRVVSVTRTGPATEGFLVQTHAVAVKETGPKETVARFGEVYSFAPAFLAVHRDEPTQIRFWNLQPDDRHDFMLVDPQANVIMKVLLPPLEETSFVFTFHREGLFRFYCTMHQPSMSGQILVLPP
jgi:plastocyanin